MGADIKREEEVPKNELKTFVLKEEGRLAPALWVGGKTRIEVEQLTRVAPGRGTQPEKVRDNGKWCIGVEGETDKPRA